jgi:hypothetical protein
MTPAKSLEIFFLTCRTIDTESLIGAQISVESRRNPTSKIAGKVETIAEGSGDVGR